MRKIGVLATAVALAFTGSGFLRAVTPAGQFIVVEIQQPPQQVPCKGFQAVFCHDLGDGRVRAYCHGCGSLECRCDRVGLAIARRSDVVEQLTTVLEQVEKVVTDARTLRMIREAIARVQSGQTSGRLFSADDVSLRIDRALASQLAGC